MNKFWRIGVTLVVAGSLLSAPVGAAYGSSSSLKHVGKTTVVRPASHPVLARHISPMDEPYCC
jgi:hypothetical protein